MPGCDLLIPQVRPGLQNQTAIRRVELFLTQAFVEVLIVPTVALSCFVLTQFLVKPKCVNSQLRFAASLWLNINKLSQRAVDLSALLPLKLNTPTALLVGFSLREPKNAWRPKFCF